MTPASASGESEPVGCERCGGTGKITYTTLGDAMPRPLGDGTTIQSMGGFSTRPCECVRDLSATDGDATWWDSESVYHGVMAECIYPDDCFEIEVRAEVPRREDGRRVHLRGNRYYPTMVDFAGPTTTTLHAYAARELAEKLLAAVEVAEAIDKPCADLCGHWAPCGCVADAVAFAVAPVVGMRMVRNDWNQWEARPA